MLGLMPKYKQYCSTGICALWLHRIKVIRLIVLVLRGLKSLENHNINDDDDDLVDVKRIILEKVVSDAEDWVGDVKGWDVKGW